MPGHATGVTGGLKLMAHQRSSLSHEHPHMPTDLLSVEIPPCYEAKSSPELWNRAFENILHITTAEDYLVSITFEDRMSPGKHQRNLEEYPIHVQNLCHLQLEVSILTLNAMDSNDLAAKWLDASLNVRKKHVLIGLAGACGSSLDLNYARLSCAKELHVSYLSTDRHILLELVNALAPYDLTQVPDNPQYINNDEWDKVQNARKDCQDEVEKLALARILVLRSKLITHVIHFIICSFLGLELPQITVEKKAHSRTKTTLTSKPLELFRERALLAKYGTKQVEEFRAVHKAACKEQAAKKVNVCRGCDRQATTRDIFKRCGACWNINREVLYCSEKCQRANWKQHKLMCGKPLDYDTAVKLATSPTTSNDASDILPPANGFKPPLELRLQMKYLKEHPAFDYFVLRSNYTNGEKYALLAWGDPIVGSFRKHRDNAMKSGDRFSAALICDCVLWDIEFRKAADFQREKIVDQFSREYKIPMAKLELVLEEMGNFRASTHNRLPILAHLHDVGARAPLY